jgi:predicted lactoylglutathione lyase
VAQSRKLFVNLAVRDLNRSMEFFAKLGFGCDPKFTDDNAACTVISEEAFVMLSPSPSSGRSRRGRSAT